MQCACDNHEITFRNKQEPAWTGLRPRCAVDKLLNFVGKIEIAILKYDEGCLNTIK